MASTKQLRDKLAPVLTIVGESLRDELEEVLRLAEVGLAAEARFAEIQRIAGGVGSSAPASRSSGGSSAAAPAKTRGRPAKKGKASKAASSSGQKDGRIRSEKPLREILEEILRKQGAAMKVRDLTTAAQASGWQTTSADPSKLVAVTLAKL